MAWRTLNGLRLKEARERARLTLDDAKRALGVSWMYLEGLEKDEIDDPIWEVVRDAADLYRADYLSLWSRTKLTRA